MQFKYLFPFFLGLSALIPSRAREEPKRGEKKLFGTQQKKKKARIFVNNFGFLNFSRWVQISLIPFHFPFGFEIAVCKLMPITRSRRAMLTREKGNVD